MVTDYLSVNASTAPSTMGVLELRYENMESTDVQQSPELKMYLSKRTKVLISKCA